MDNVAYWQEQEHSLSVSETHEHNCTQKKHCGKKVVYIFITCHDQESAVSLKTMIANVTLYKSSNE